MTQHEDVEIDPVANCETLTRILNKEGYGPPIQEYQDDLKIVFDHLNGYAQAAASGEECKPGVRAPHVAIVDDHDVQAIASHDAGVDFIAITTGAIQVLSTLFRALLALPTILPKKGSLGSDLPRPRWKKLYRSARRLPDPPQLPDPTRRAWACALYVLALDFLIFHEIGHVWRAHTRLSSNGRYALLFEAPATESAAPATESAAPATESDSLMLHTFEMDADSYAISTMIPNILAACEGKGPYAKLGHALGWTREDAVYACLYAVYAFFRLFSDEDVDLDHLDRGSHPAPSIRQTWCIQTIGNFASKNLLPISEARLRRMAEEVSDAVERAFATLLHVEPITNNMLTNQDPRVDAHRERVERMFEQIKPQIVDQGYGTWTFLPP